MTLLSIEQLINFDTEFYKSAMCFVIGFGGLFALLMCYHDYYLEKQRRRNESNHQDKMKKWKH